MIGELFLNGKDAFTEYGIIMGCGCYASLVCPPPAKEYVTSESRLEDGKEYLTDYTHINERSIALQLYIKAEGYDDFYRKITRFANEILSVGAISIKTKYQPSVIYHCVYKQITQLSEFNGRGGKFLLNVVENNPSNRS